MGFLDFLKKKGSAPLEAAPAPAKGNYGHLVAKALAEALQAKTSVWETKIGELPTYKAEIQTLPDAEKLSFMLQAIQKVQQYYKRSSYEVGGDEHHKINLWEQFLQALLRGKLVLNDIELSHLLEAFTTHHKYGSASIFNWPIGLALQQVERQLKDRNPSPPLAAALQKLKAAAEAFDNPYYEKEKRKVANRIDSLLVSGTAEAEAVKPFRFVGNDPFVPYANEWLTNLPPDARPYWAKLLHHAANASGGTPSKKYLATAAALLEPIGKEAFSTTLNEWALFLIRIKDTVTERVSTFHGQEHRYTETLYITPPTMETVKGLVWIASTVPSKGLLQTIAVLAERCHRKIPGQGPAAATLGNACLYTLSAAPGLDGIAHLSRLRLRIRQANTQMLIAKYLSKAAAAQSMTTEEVEDRAVDDHGLVNGKREWNLSGYRAVLSITGIGKTETQWYKPDGTPQKAVPTTVKADHAAKLKEIKETAKAVETTLTAQRDRLDAGFKLLRSWEWETFRTYFLEHGLMGWIANRLILVFEKDGAKAASIAVDGAWTSPSGPLPFQPDEGTTVSLWHPVFESVNGVRDWRTFLLDSGINQPLKQAFREVYLLTEAEINTRTYSNRMAAHLLKQHQFNSLAKLRGWRYSLMGAWDNGANNGNATLDLPHYGLRAEFWINEISDNATESGILTYVATDQVRFMAEGGPDPVELVNIPPLVLSEVLRDVDLFVGVASVGNDPQWRDNGGLPAYRDYWQSFSFGELTEVAKTRKALLERLVPRLKIGAVSEIRDKFLVVKGKLRTYKIHLGSTNILMEPNDQYLCIVPDRSAKPEATNLFLGFEGDSGVSVIISKAILLADDDKITDATITSQIRRS